MAKPKVVLIAGSGHGGTTILNMILGQHPGIFATGKLRDFPHGGLFVDDNICSCGTAAAACPFWAQVRNRYAPYQERPESERIPKLFQIVSELSNTPFVVDVTHNVGYGEQLQRISGIELYLMHVVRDGRGVVYSRIRKDHRIGRLGKSRWQHFRRVITVSRRWAWHIKHFAALERKLGDKAVRISYEQLCSDPGSALTPVSECLGLDFTEVGTHLGSGQPLRPMAHLIRGNAILRTKQDVVLRHDTAYLDEMPSLDRLIFGIASKLPVF